MTLRSYNYASVLPVKVSRPYFSTRPQGARERFGVWGRDKAGWDLFRSAFQSSNSIGQFIIHDYMGIRAVALTTP